MTADHGLTHVDETGAARMVDVSGKAVSVRSAVATGRVLVSDDGPGVPREDLPHLFERFRRGADAAARPGVGLGLAIARDLALRSGGDLEYAGDGPGASFRLALPRPPEGAP